MATLFMVGCNKDEDPPTPEVVASTSANTSNTQIVNGSCSAIIDGLPFTANYIFAGVAHFPEVLGPQPIPEYHEFRFHANESNSPSIDIVHRWYSAQTHPTPMVITLPVSPVTTTVTFTVNDNYYYVAPQWGELNILSVDTTKTDFSFQCHDGLSIS